MSEGLKTTFEGIHRLEDGSRLKLTARLCMRGGFHFSNEANYEVMVQHCEKGKRTWITKNHTEELKPYIDDAKEMLYRQLSP